MSPMPGPGHAGLGVGTVRDVRAAGPSAAAAAWGMIAVLFSRRWSRR